ncbi:MAG: ABC transporter permease [Phycisphaerales bacterium]
MSSPAPANPIPSPAEAERPRRSLLRRLVAVQEVGLLIVIAVMMLGIYLFAGTISGEPIRLSEDQTVAESAGLITVTTDGLQTDRYRTADNYRFIEDRRGRQIQRFEVRPAPAGATVAVTSISVIDRRGQEESQGALVFRTPAGDSAPFRFSDGWQAGDDGASVERPYQVSKFFNKNNLVLVLTTSSFYAIMAVGMTLIIIMGGIDLSIGSIYALAAVGTALLLRAVQSGAEGGDPISPALAIPLAVGVCTLLGAITGAVNGIAIVGLRVHPFIITLGGMAVYRGIAFVLSEGQSIAGFPGSFRECIRYEVAGISPVPAGVMLLTGLIGAFVASRTTFGRRTFAIGGNETAARYAGIPVGKVKIALYTIGGATAGLAAAIGLGYFGSATSDSARGYELGVIAAAVVGGASLSGGRGSILGAVLGAIIIQLIENGFDVLGIDTNYKQIVIGLSIVLAVLVDQLKQRFLARG